MENNQNNWKKHYIKSNIWFSFGTLVNGWALIKKNDPSYSLDDYKKDIDKLYQKAFELVNNTYDKCEEVEVKKDTSPIDIPIKST
jgi:hypothetical protein